VATAWKKGPPYHDERVAVVYQRELNTEFGITYPCRFREQPITPESLSDHPPQRKRGTVLGLIIAVLFSLRFHGFT
jgi:hypothetical protein